MTPLRLVNSFANQTMKMETESSAEILLTGMASYIRRLEFY